MRFVRELGRMESQMAAYHETLNGGTQTCSRLSVQGPLTAAGLRTAAHALFKKYAFLRCSMERLGDRYQLYEHDDFSRITLRFRTQAAPWDWASNLEVEAQENLDASHALWRLLLISSEDGQSHEILLTAHHAVCDGLSIILFFSDLLAKLDRCVSQVRESMPQDEMESLPVPKKIEWWLPQEAFPQETQTLASPELPYSTVVAPGSRSINCHWVRLEADDVSLIQANARSQGVSVGSWLAAAYGMAAEEVLDHEFVLRTAVSLRQRLSLTATEQKQMACYIAVSSVPAGLDRTSISRRARAYHAAIQDYLQEPGRWQIPLSFAEIQKKTRDLAVARTFPHGISITNLGRVQFPTDIQHFRVDDFCMLAVRNAGNFALSLHIASVNSILNCGFAFANPLISPERVGQVARRFVQHLKESL
jgi:hypothetical protein